MQHAAPGHAPYMLISTPSCQLEEKRERKGVKDKEPVGVTNPGRMASTVVSPFLLQLLDWSLDF